MRKFLLFSTVVLVSSLIFLLFSAIVFNLDARDGFNDEVFTDYDYQIAPSNSHILWYTDDAVPARKKMR